MKKVEKEHLSAGTCINFMAQLHLSYAESLKEQSEFIESKEWEDIEKSMLSLKEVESEADIRTILIDVLDAYNKMDDKEIKDAKDILEKNGDLKYDEGVKPKDPLGKPKRLFRKAQEFSATAKVVELLS